jgi:HAD superfamily hydrolase (TIGR01459 family)
MTTLISDLSRISDRYNTVYCDLWGCLHNGQRPHAAAVAALRAFRAGGGKVLLLTNSPRPAPGVIRQLDVIGVPRDCWDLIATSGDAAQSALFSGAVGRKVWHLGPERDLPFFTETAEDVVASDIERVDLAQAQGIVCTGLFDDRNETPEDYRGRLLMAKVNGLKMLCANPDLVVDYGDRRIYCAGALAQLYTELGGEVLYFGKPHPPIYDLAARRLDRVQPVQPDRILCIGDGIGTDIAGAQLEGLDALFITGGLAADQFGPDPETPDKALLKPWLARHHLSPRWAMGMLR